MCILNTDNLVSQDKPVYIKPDFGDLISPEQTINEIISGTFKNKSQEDQYNILKTTYSRIFDEIFNNCNNELLNSLVNEASVFTSFVSIISNIKLSYEQIQYYTKLAYGYINKKKDRNKNITEILLNSCKLIYKNLMVKLSRIISEDQAIYLCICRYSSDKEFINVRRINNTLLNIPNLNQQSIVDIFSILYDRMTPLFIGTMFNTNSNEELSGDYKSSVYSMISNAILYILDNMEIESMKKVLIAYSEEIRLGERKPIRFSLHSIAPSEFPRVFDTINSLELNGIVLI